MHKLTLAELQHRAAELDLQAAELDLQAERMNLGIPGVQQRRAWALRKRYLQQAEDYRNLAQIAGMNDGT